MHGDVCKSVYCHWDGYLSNNGRILQEHYADSAKANNLVALGQISSLRPEIGVAHPFSMFEDNISSEEYDRLYGDMTTFYGRDRGEEDVGYQIANSFEEFLEQVDQCCGEYYYVMRDGVWYAGCVYETQGLIKGGLVPLAEALEALAVAEDE
jgi:hypothetical protein